MGGTGEPDENAPPPAPVRVIGAVKRGLASVKETLGGK